MCLAPQRYFNIGIVPTGASEIARRSRGTLRIANRLLKRVRDFAQVIGDGVITQEIADEALQRLYVDKWDLIELIDVCWNVLLKI